MDRNIDLFIYLSRLPIYLSIYRYIYLSIFPSIYHIYLYLSISISLHIANA